MCCLPQKHTASSSIPRKSPNVKEMREDTAPVMATTEVFPSPGSLAHEGAVGQVQGL